MLTPTWAYGFIFRLLRRACSNQTERFEARNESEAEIGRFTPSDWSKSRNEAQETGRARFRFSLLLSSIWIKQNLKTSSQSRSKRERRPWRPPQLQTPRRPDSQRTESRKYVKNVPLMTVSAASTTAGKPVAHGAVSHRIEYYCCTFRNRLLEQVMMLLEQHSFFVQRRSRASAYRRPCSSRVWSASRVSTLPSFLKVGGRQQSWCSTSIVALFSFFILAFVCRAYPAFILRPRFSRKGEVCALFCFCFSLFVFPGLYGPLTPGPDPHLHISIEQTGPEITERECATFVDTDLRIYLLQYGPFLSNNASIYFPLFFPTKAGKAGNAYKTLEI